MSTRVDDICNEEQRIYVTTVDVMFVVFVYMFVVHEGGFNLDQDPKKYQKSKTRFLKYMNTVFKFWKTIKYPPTNPNGDGYLFNHQLPYLAIIRNRNKPQLLLRWVLRILKLCFSKIKD
jgi:hypothetical protein